MVSGHGNGAPDVMLVADYPQGEDLITNYAISGYKERMLKEFAKNAGLDYNNFYKTCLIKDDPPKFENWHITKKGKKGSKKKYSEIEIARHYNEKVTPLYANVLQTEIKELQPNLVIPLGEISFQYLSGLSSIRKFRGSVLKLNPLLGIEKYTKILPILGPYPYLFSEYRQKFITTIDFDKIKKWSDARPIPDDTYKVWVCRSYNALRNFLDRAYPICANKSVADGGFLTFDIETYMNVPTCVSFCFDGFESCCVAFLDPSVDRDQKMMMLDLVARILASPIPKVNQNIKYDWKTMERWGFKVNNVVGDTMLAASTLYCEFPKNLGFLTSIYTDIPYFKDEGRQYDPSKHKKDQFYLYCAKDSLSTHQIHSKQIPETIELGTTSVYSKLIQLIPVYRRCEDRGIRIDETKRQKLLAKYQSLFRIHCSILRRLVGNDGLNPLSSVQMNELVYQELKYGRIRGTKGTDEESLNMLMCFGQPDNGTTEAGKLILQEIIFCRKIHKVLEILDLDIYPDGRFRCEFNLAGTETGRTSAGKTTDYFIRPDYTKTAQKVKTINLGHSLQTIGKHGFFIGQEKYGEDVRSMFVPSPGYVFVENDLSGAEARVDRVLSGNYDMGVFDNPGIHKLTGSWLFNCKPTDIKKNTLEYHLSKTFRHAGERNMGPNRAFMMCQDEGTGLSLDLRDVTDKLQIFHNNEPQIRAIFHRDVEASIKGTNCLVAPNGRRRDFFDRIDNHTINEGISTLPQMVVSDQTKFSFIPTFSEATWAYLLVEAHDGALSEVPRGREADFAIIYKRNVETEIDFRRGSLKRDYCLTIPCESSVGENWGELEAFDL